jgi:hypothetical protein
LIPAIESKSVEEEEKLHLSFYNFLSSCNKDATLRSELRKNLNVTVTQIQFSYSKGKECVEAKFVARWFSEIHKLQRCLKNDNFSCWLEDYLNSIGLGVELGGNYAKKIGIVAYEIKNEDNPERR